MSLRSPTREAEAHEAVVAARAEARMALEEENSKRPIPRRSPNQAEFLAEVDLFGNPVSNVEAWLREQSRLSRAGPKSVQAPSKSGAQDKPRRSRSAIGRLFSACLPARRVSTPTAISN